MIKDQDQNTTADSLVIKDTIISPNIEKNIIPDDTIRIDNVNDFYMSINNNVTIKLAPGDYRLDHIDSNLMNPNCKWAVILFDEILEDDSFKDDLTLLIKNIQGLNLVGSNSNLDSVRILTNRKTASVLAFENCENINITGITLGHDLIKYTDSTDPWVSFCSGEVLEFFDSENITLTSCVLFGCGTRGFLAHRCENFKIRDSGIKECSWGAFGVFDSENFTIENCLFINNQYRKLFEIENTNNLEVKYSIISNNTQADQYTESVLSVQESTDIFFTNCQISNNDFTEEDILGIDHY